VGTEDFQGREFELQAEELVDQYPGLETVPRLVRPVGDHRTVEVVGIGRQFGPRRPERLAVPLAREPYIVRIVGR
jgi:hypothetical protein